MQACTTGCIGVTSVFMQVSSVTTRLLLDISDHYPQGHKAAPGPDLNELLTSSVPVTGRRPVKEEMEYGQMEWMVWLSTWQNMSDESTSVHFWHDPMPECCLDKTATCTSDRTKRRTFLWSKEPTTQIKRESDSQGHHNQKIWSEIDICTGSRTACISSGSSQTPALLPVHTLRVPSHCLQVVDDLASDAILDEPHWQPRLQGSDIASK